MYLGDNLGHISIYLDNCLQVPNLVNSNILWDIVKHIFSLLSSLFKSLPIPVSAPKAENSQNGSDFNSLPKQVSIPAKQIFARTASDFTPDFPRMRFFVDETPEENIDRIIALADGEGFKSDQGRFYGSVSQSNQTQSYQALINEYPIGKFHVEGEQDTTVNIDTNEKTVTATRTFSIKRMNEEDAPEDNPCQRIQSITRVFFGNSAVTMKIDFQNALDNQATIPAAIEQG
ncbi:hypothetical protein EB008_03590 [bacterium]|nr:hypothetical protein [bacterium]